MADTDSTTATIDKLKQTLIFTYGTLKRDFPNYNLLHDLISQNRASYLGTYITHHPYPLVIGPHGIPFLINLPGAGHRVTGELYSVSTCGLGTVDELEGTNCGHYERLPIQVMKVKESDLDVEGGILIDAETYYANRSFGERLWEARGRVGLVDFKHRPKGSSFLGDIHLLLSKCSGQDV
ncbi:hypothetical protein K2173_016898 [Erythroxylum novogranatense]|uniref:Gamma-glutamylcyclotransferase family protein n=1 Tax=Erythroxylum novogranatense TaxID=1862640 RepID=A0AAV8U563_9ROSI|nr:hypothetical protein K2173_016898 [Erythroxylum novogranatense]